MPASQIELKTPFQTWNPDRWDPQLVRPAGTVACYQWFSPLSHHGRRPNPWNAHAKFKWIKSDATQTDPAQSQFNSTNRVATRPAFGGTLRFLALASEVPLGPGRHSHQFLSCSVVTLKCTVKSLRNGLLVPFPDKIVKKNLVVPQDLTLSRRGTPPHILLHRCLDPHAFGARSVPHFWLLELAILSANLCL